jgi:osmotically-inducible protein OsmY
MNQPHPGRQTIAVKGTVHAWAEREEAERVAWSAPGVTAVENRVIIQP